MFCVENSEDPIRENKILAKIFGFTVLFVEMISLAIVLSLIIFSLVQ